MSLIDYTFTITGGQDIIFNEKLTPAKLGLEPGDRFELVTVDKTVVLMKLPKGTPIEKDPDDFWYKREYVS